MVAALVRRDLARFVRDRHNLAASLARPLLWLIALGFGLRGAFVLDTGEVDYLSFLVPGIAVMSILFTSTFAAISIVWDREFGFLKELLVAPVPRSSIVLARMLSGATLSILEAGTAMLVAPLLGARFSAGGALLALLVYLVFGMGVSALGIVVAARMRSFEGFGGIVNFIIQPLFFFSGAFYPLDGLPRPLAVLVRLNPATYAVDAARGLALGVQRFPLALDLSVVVLGTLLMWALATRAFSKM